MGNLNMKEVVENTLKSINNLRDVVAGWCRENATKMVSYRRDIEGVWGTDSEPMYCYYEEEGNAVIITDDSLEFASDIYDAPIEEVIAIAQAIADDEIVEK